MLKDFDDLKDSCFLDISGHLLIFFRSGFHITHCIIRNSAHPDILASWNDQAAFFPIR